MIWKKPTKYKWSKNLWNLFQKMKNIILQKLKTENPLAGIDLAIRLALTGGRNQRTQRKPLCVSSDQLELFSLTAQARIRTRAAVGSKCLPHWHTCKNYLHILVTGNKQTAIVVLYEEHDWHTLYVVSFSYILSYLYQFKYVYITSSVAKHFPDKVCGFVSKLPRIL